MLQDNVKVSIILPVYNAEKYIAKCIDSIVLDNSFNFELIIVNDGSTDDTDCIINTYDDGRIVYLKQNNSGVSKARNLGLSYARGEYIIFVDSDDYLVPKSLSTRIINSESTDLLISRFYNINVNGEQLEDRKEQIDNGISITQALSTLTSKSRIGYQGYLWNKVFRREIIEQNNIRFDNDIAYGEDRLFVAEYILHCKAVRVSSQIVYCYRENCDGTMSLFGKINNDNSKKMLSEIDGLKKLKEIIEQQDTVLARYITIQCFFTAIRFARNTNKDTRKAKNICVREAWKCLKSILMFPGDFYSPMKKLKTIGHFLLLR